MDKKTFLAELKAKLTLNHISDTEDIIAEYENHFLRKAEDGYTEEEISAKLGDPNQIAKQYIALESNSEKSKSTGSKIMTGIGLGFADIFVFTLLISVYACVVALASAAAAFVFSGICLIFQPVMPSSWTLPEMPYAGGFLLGVSIIALGVVFWVFTQYSALFTGKITYGYFRWHKNTFSGSIKPPYVVFPVVKKEKSRRMRLTLLISLFVFAIFAVLGFVFLTLQAGSVEFWHVWHWFE